MIKRLVYSAQKAKSGKTDQAVLASLRDSKLKQISIGLLESIVQSYSIEKESTMMTTVNLSAHIAEAQKRENNYWDEVIKNTGFMSTRPSG